MQCMHQLLLKYTKNLLFGMDSDGNETDFQPKSPLLVMYAKQTNEFHDL
jgi:hypothetical protein